MASEYLKQKYKDVKPDEKVELTPAEKRKNWWYYHKWHMVIGAVLALMAADIVWTILGRGELEPDYQIAYVGAGNLPDDTAAAIEAGFAALSGDLNGDGQVLVRLRQYVSSHDSDPSALAAVQVQMMADIMACESLFFLLEDPEDFQASYHALCRLDGSLPEEDDNSAEGVALLWENCPVLAEMELGEYVHDIFGSSLTGSSQDLLSPLYIARRSFLTDQEKANQEGYSALWERLIAGAVS